MNSDDFDILLVEDNEDDMVLALHALRREKIAKSPCFFSVTRVEFESLQ
jgi:hypothetical protein